MRVLVSIPMAAFHVLVLGGAAALAPTAQADPGGGAPTAAEAQAVIEALPARLGVRGEAFHMSTHPLADVAPPPPPPGTPRPTESVTVEAYRAPAAPGGAIPAGGGWSPTGRLEDVRVGPYHQPEWTTDRRWARVRSYVIAPWQVEVESWMRARFGRDDQPDRYIFQEEFGIGLPHRFQFDFYLNFEDNDERSFHYAETQLELRWALANWDCLWMNPTLYFEYRLHDDPDESDAVEAKLLLSDDLARRWVGGVNLIYERELSGEEEEVYGVAAAVSYSVVDQRFYVGAEFQWEAATVAGARDEFEHTWYLGPSFSWRLNRRTHLDVAPLFGLNDASNFMQLFVVLGFDIGPGGGEGGGGAFNPVGARSR